MFALVAILLTAASLLPTTGADEPTVVPLAVSQPLDAIQECLAIVAAETPAEREARVVDGMEYVRVFYPDLDEAGLRASSEDLLRDRCKLAPIELPPARKELVGDRWVVHAGEHSIKHDKWHGLATSPGAPMNIHFFGVQFGVDAGVAVKNAIDASGWQAVSALGCGGEKITSIYDGGHGTGAGTSYPQNAYHMQREEDECQGSARYHVRLWPSSVGDTHPGPTYGGYVLGSVHHEDWWGQHVTDAYDSARDKLRSNVLASGVADSYFAVDVGNGNTGVDPNADGLVFYMHMKTPSRPCTLESIVRVYEDGGHGGQCRAFDFGDGTFADNTFDNGFSLNDRVSSVYIASGYTARFYEHANHGGTQRSSRCNDSGFVAAFNDKASSLKLDKAYLDFCYATFSQVRGNEWWVQATVTPKGTETLNAVQVRINGGGWLPLTLQSWGGWAASYHMPQGSVVQLRAIAGAGGGGVDLSPCYNWIPAPNTDATTQYCNFADSPFKATFSNVRGNSQWVQVDVRGSDPRGGVEMRIGCNMIEEPWVRLAKQSGTADTWFLNPGYTIPAGTTIDFRAHPHDPSLGTPNTLSELDVSRAYLWPAVSPPTTAAATTAGTPC